MLRERKQNASEVYSMDSSKKRRRGFLDEQETASLEQQRRDEEKHASKTSKNSDCESVSNPWLTKGDVLILDIGGQTTITISRSVLTRAAGSRLAEMFSGRWDASAPKNKDGHFLIDQNPKLFLPLRDFLYSLACMVPSDAGNNPTPPMTPYFNTAIEEFAFRRMVDSFDLTNILYSYEIYQHPNDITEWNNTTIISRDCSILDCQLSRAETPDRPRYSLYSLDRPTSTHGACHHRKVQAFEVELCANPVGSIGWMRREKSFEADVDRFSADLGIITFDTRDKDLAYLDREGHSYATDSVNVSLAKNSTIRCCKNAQTNDLEWFINGELVASTSQALANGEIDTLGDCCRIGWTLPDGWEMIPYVSVAAGTCCLSALELES